MNNDGTIGEVVDAIVDSTNKRNDKLLQELRSRTEELNTRMEMMEGRLMCRFVELENKQKIIFENLGRLLGRTE